MQSNNPIFNNADGFNGKAVQRYGNQAYPAGGQGYSGYGQTPGYTDPSSWQYPTAQDPTADAVQDRMTIDTVIAKTGIVLGVIVLAAAATWVFVKEPSQLHAAWIIGALGSIGMSFAVSFMRKVNPALVLAYAALEGVFIGAVSKAFDHVAPGAVPGAVLGTVIAFASMLAVYKFFDIQVTSKFRRFVSGAMLGMFGVLMLDFVLSFFGASIGFGGFGVLGFITSVFGLVLGLAMLMLDFDMVERGIAAGLPERESWRAAFGLAVTLVWIYINLLRLLAILQDN